VPQRHDRIDHVVAAGVRHIDANHGNISATMHVTYLIPKGSATRGDVAQ
jgi:hypothetical protein